MSLCGLDGDDDNEGDDSPDGGSGHDDGAALLPESSLIHAHFVRFDH